MILSYPTTSPTLTITIPDPRLGNVEQTESNAIITQTRSGEIKTVAAWHQNTVHSYSFTTMDRTTRDALENFLIVSRGDEFAIDWNLQVWHGIILNPENEIITTKDDCSYDINFDFRGRRIS